MKLKPCPFCGYIFSEKAEQWSLVYNEESRYGFVRCEGCEAKGPVVKSKVYLDEIKADLREKMIVAWNERVKEGV
jgi:hypothetical protein